MYTEPKEPKKLYYYHHNGVEFVTPSKKTAIARCNSGYISIYEVGEDKSETLVGELELS